MLRYVGAIAALLMALMSGGTAAAQQAAADPGALVAETTDHLMGELRAQEAELRGDLKRLDELLERVVLPRIDLDALGRWVLGKHWRAASPEQREAFITEFRQLLLRSYGNALLEYAHFSVSYQPARLEDDGQAATVHAEMVRKDAPSVALDYMLHLRDGQWQIYDFSVEGISLVVNYRASFSSEIRKSGIDGLIERLRERNAAGEA